MSNNKCHTMYLTLSHPYMFLAMEPRQITRWEAARFAREAYEVGVRVVGGCCGFESHHIRAMAEELSEERGRLPAGSDKSDHDLRLLSKKAEIRRQQFKEEGSGGMELFDNKSVHFNDNDDIDDDDDDVQEQQGVLVEDDPKHRKTTVSCFLQPAPPSSCEQRNLPINIYHRNAMQ